MVKLKGENPGNYGLKLRLLKSIFLDSPFLFLEPDKPAGIPPKEGGTSKASTANKCQMNG